VLIVHLSYYYVSRFCTACTSLSDCMTTADYLSSHIITLTAKPTSFLRVSLTMWNISGKTHREKKSNISHYPGFNYHCLTVFIQKYPVFQSPQKAEVKERNPFSYHPNPVELNSALSCMLLLLPGHGHSQGKTLPWLLHEAPFPVKGTNIQLFSI